MVYTISNETKRRTTYLLAGLVLGIAIMVGPALLLSLLPIRLDTYLWQSGLPARFDDPLASVSPLAVVIEVLWLILPALTIILALYWLAVHRTRSPGYDEAAKLSHR
jgi:hypothetical protein